MYRDEQIDLDSIFAGREHLRQTAIRIAFSMIKGIKVNSARQLVRRIGSEERFFSLGENEINTAFAARNKFAGTSYRLSLIERAIEEAQFVIAHKIKPVYFTDQAYPVRLSECGDAPVLLYILGDMDFNIPRIISIVGTRHATAYGVNFTRRLIEEIAEKYPGTAIISGLAYGIDVTAHTSCLNAGLPTAAVMGHSLDTVYPATHRGIAIKIIESGGALVSEYATNTPVHRSNFLSRNRIVAGLSDMTLVIESDIKGGSLVTASIAREYDREVGALPGRVTDQYSRGCNQLIAKNIAGIIRGLDDIVETLGWQSVVTPKTLPLDNTLELDDTERTVLDYIRNNPDNTVNEISLGLGIPYSDLSPVLFRMEMNDVIVEIPGGKYMPGS